MRKCTEQKPNSYILNPLHIDIHVQFYKSRNNIKSSSHDLTIIPLFEKPQQQQNVIRSNKFCHHLINHKLYITPYHLTFILVSNRSHSGQITNTCITIETDVHITNIEQYELCSVYP